jgi:hypothetical protein
VRLGGRLGLRVRLGVRLGLRVRLGGRLGVRVRVRGEGEGEDLGKGSSWCGGLG